MVAINLFDLIKIKKAPQNVITSNVKIENNTILKAVNLMKEQFGIKDNFKIKLRKRIPIGAGLGGASCNAASIIMALNKMYNLKLAKEKLISLAITIGSDVPFCLFNRPSIVSGIGQKINFINNLAIVPKHLYLYLNNINVSTKVIFDNFTSNGNRQSIIKNKQINYFNDLTNITINQYPQLRIYTEQTKLFMTGSGSTFFNFDKIKKRQFKSKKYKILD